MQYTNHRNNNFNLLRFALASLVILSHAPELHDGNREREVLTRLFHTLSFGELAVDGFFLLSGYLITQSWQREPRAYRFFIKRVLRILPAFVVASLLSVAVIGPLAAAEPATYWAEFSSFRFLQGLAVLYPPITPEVFPGRPHPELNGAMWSIRWEFLCYVVVVITGLVAGLRFKAAWAVLTLLWSSVWLIEGLTHGTSAQLSFPYQQHPLWRLLTCFFAGGCFQLFEHRLSVTPCRVSLALALLIAGMFSSRLAEPALIVFGGFLLFAAAHRPVAQLAAFNRAPDVSYGVYLYGWPIQNLASATWPRADVWLMLPAVYLTAIALAALSWYLIERPALSLKRLAGARSIPRYEQPQC